jgi:hypothetical protein
VGRPEHAGQEPFGPSAPPDRHGDVLPSVDAVGRRAAVVAASTLELPQQLPGAGRSPQHWGPGRASCLARLFAQLIVRSAEPSVDPPPAEVVEDSLPRRILPGQHAPRAAAPQQVEHGIRDPACRHLGGRPRLSERLSSGLRMAQSSSERSDG